MEFLLFRLTDCYCPSTKTEDLKTCSQSATLIKYLHYRDHPPLLFLKHNSPFWNISYYNRCNFFIFKNSFFSISNGPGSLEATPLPLEPNGREAISGTHTYRGPCSSPPPADLLPRRQGVHCLSECVPRDCIPLQVHISGPWGPRIPNSLRPASWAEVGLFPHPTSGDIDQMGASPRGQLSGVCVRVDLGHGGWSVLKRPLTVHKAAEAGEIRELGAALLPPPCFLMELQESRHSKLRITY